MSDASGSIAAKKRELNLNVLKRHDPSILEIVDSTSYVVLYRYADKAGGTTGEMSWVKTHIEGSMFLVKRSSTPSYGFWILNRHGTDNFAEDLVDEANLELTSDYIIVQSPDDKIHGIWIFEQDHRARIGERMIELCHMSKASKSLAQAAATVPAPPSQASSSPTRSNLGGAKPKLAGQSISLDMLFGGGQQQQPQPQGSSDSQQLDNVQFHQHQQPQPAPLANNNNNTQAQAQGMNLLDSLFSAASLNSHQQSVPPTQDLSPNIEDRLTAAQQNIGIAQAADENALKSLLGLTSSVAAAASAPAPFSATNMPGQTQHYSQPLASQYPLQPYYQGQQQHQQQSQYHQASNPQLQSYSPHGPPQQQSLAHAGQQGMPRQSGPNSNSSPVQSHKQPPSQQHFQAHRQPLPPQQQQPNRHFVTAPLMPSVILNKNRSSGQASSTTSPQSSVQPLGPTSPQYQHGYAQPAPVVQQALSPPILRALTPLRQSQTVRYGAESIPPPPVPPAASRPYQQPAPSQQPAQALDRSHAAHGSPSQSNPSQQYDQNSARLPAPGAPAQILAPKTAMDLLTQQLGQSALYQPLPPQAAYQQKSPILDRYAFRDQVIAMLQDASFAEALYQSYIASKSQSRQ